VDKPNWTIETYAAHNEALRVAEEKFQTERDRRYSEVTMEREKALRIKEEADRTALGLQRDTQIYKDEKANELRSQIERERGTYATKTDLQAAVEKIDVTLKSLQAYAASQQGKGMGMHAGWVYLIGGVGLFLVIVQIIQAFSERM